jgi:hypothetical protein
MMFRKSDIIHFYIQVRWLSWFHPQSAVFISHFEPSRHLADCQTVSHRRKDISTMMVAMATKHRNILGCSNHGLATPARAQVRPRSLPQYSQTDGYNDRAAVFQEIVSQSHPSMVISGTSKTHNGMFLVLYVIQSILTLLPWVYSVIALANRTRV